MEYFLENPDVSWFLIGLILLLTELAFPGLIVIFFGVGAWITALFCLFFDISINFQLLVFLITSLVSLALLRKVFRERFYNSNDEGDLEDEYIGQTGVALINFTPDQIGKVTFKGSTWAAVTTEPVEAGQLVKITGYKSIQLFVKPLRSFNQ